MGVVITPIGNLPNRKELFVRTRLEPLGQMVKLMMNFISFCDGQVSLFEIAENLNLPIWELYELVDKLESHRLVSVKK